MKKVVSSRLRITKNGKVMRRPMGLGHCQSKKSNVQKGRSKGMRNLSIGKNILEQNR